MKKFKVLVWGAVTSSCLLAATPVSASYYCDNDRDASMYPYCTNSQSNAAYATGTGWNNDTRWQWSSPSSPSGTANYRWNFTNLTLTTGYHDVLIWVGDATNRNSYAANTKVSYYWNGELMGYIDQTPATGYVQVGKSQYIWSGQSHTVESNNYSPYSSTLAWDVVALYR